MTAVTVPDQGTTSYQYNVFGEVTAVTDPLGNTTAYTYDNAGRLTKTTDALGNEASVTYDAVGNKTSVTDPNGNITGYTYGALNLLQSVTDPLGQSVNYKYNLVGQLTQMMDKGESITRNRYNSMGFLTETNVKKPGETEASAENQISYAYDCMGNRTAMQDVSGSYSYSYDALNRLTSIEKNGETQIAYTYTAENQIASAAYASSTTAYAYDSCGRLSSVRNGVVGADYTYDDNGNVTVVSYTNGVVEQLSYNKFNGIVSITNKNAANTTISSYSYTYDAAGRQTGKTDGFGTTSYSYDSVGRITQVQAPGKTSQYQYDAAGNRTGLVEEYADEKTFTEIDEGHGNVVQYKKKEVTYSYNGNNQLVNSIENMYDAGQQFVIGKTASYTYDQNGNQAFVTEGILSQGQGTEGVEVALFVEGQHTLSGYISITENSYDGFGRLTNVKRIRTSGTTSTSFVYNGDGLRTSKTVQTAEGPQTVNYQYDGQYVVRESGASTATYVRGLSYIAKIGASNETSYYLYNAHGDVVQLTDAVGVVKNQYDYDSFGTASLEIEEVENSIRYSGEFYDASTELYYLRARYYNSETGRFISADSYAGGMKDPASLNLYSYCLNDPVQHVDPSGHVSEQQQKSITSAFNAFMHGIISKEEYQASVRLNGGIPLGGDLKNINSKTLYLSSRDGGTKVAVVFDSGGGHLINLSNSNNSKLSKEEKTDLQLAAEARKSNEISAEEFLEIIKMSGDSLAVLMVSDYSYRNPFQLLSYADPNESEKYDRLKFNKGMAIGWMTKTDGSLNVVLNIRDLDYDDEGAMTTEELQSNKEKVQQRIDLQWNIIELFMEASAITGRPMPSFFIETPHHINEIKQKQLDIAVEERIADGDTREIEEIRKEVRAEKESLFADIYIEDVKYMYEELQKRVDEKAAKADIVIGDTSSIIRGFYYGREDPDHGDLTLQYTILGKLSKYVHGELGKMLIWIPYCSTFGHGPDEYDPTGMNNDNLDTIAKYINQGYVENGTNRTIFDIVFLQPGMFYDEIGHRSKKLKDIKNWEQLDQNDRDTKMATILDSIKKQALIFNGEIVGGKKLTSTMVGFEFEFDMSLITGRQIFESDITDPNEAYYADLNTATPYQKMQKFYDYYIMPFKGLIAPLQSIGITDESYIKSERYIPVAIYSGGLNEQAYDYIGVPNPHTHNPTNHKAFDPNVDPLEKGRSYSNFTVQYNGNVIQDIYDGLWGIMNGTYAWTEELKNFFRKGGIEWYSFGE